MAVKATHANQARRGGFGWNKADLSPGSLIEVPRELSIVGSNESNPPVLTAIEGRLSLSEGKHEPPYIARAVLNEYIPVMPYPGH